MRRGFTLVEIVVVIAILAVLAAVGWGTMRDQLPRFQTVGAAKRLQRDILELRSMAVQTDRQTRLRFVSSPGDCTDPESYGGRWELEIGDKTRGSTKWDLLPADLIETGADDDQSRGVVDYGADGNNDTRAVCLQQWSDLAGPSTGNNNSLVFNPRGWLDNPSEDFGTTGRLTITFVNLRALDEGRKDSISLTLTRAGVVHLVSPSDGDATQNPVGTATSSTGS